MRKSIFTLVAIVAATTVSGCASLNQRTIDEQSVANIKGQPVTYTSREKPDFTAMTAGKAAFALLGAVAMVSEGNKIVAANNVEDPAGVIATGLAKELEMSHSIQFITPPIKVDGDDASQIASGVKGAARYVIDAQTVNWSFGYFPTDWTHYRVIYTARARLIDVQSNDVIAEGFCKHNPDSNLNAPTYDELLANQANLLKSELSTISQECINTMKTQMFAL